MTPPPPTPNPTPKADSGAGALLRRLWDYYADENEVPPHDCEFKDNPEAGKCDFHELWGEIDALMRATATPPQSNPAMAAAEASIGVSYQSACSGLWYSNASAAGTIRAIKIGVEIYELKQDAPAPAPKGRGETPRTDRAAKNLDTREEVLDFARSLEIENNELRELKSTWEIGAKRHNEVKAQRAAAVAQAQAASELTARWRNLVKAYVSERPVHGRDDHSCALCAALASSPPALAASEAGK